VVRVAFAIDRTGLVTGARVTRSSGSAVLDRAALDTLRRASPVPAPPAEMRPLSFSVPMTFALR
jgi:periplasmic protein TonB